MRRLSMKSKKGKATDHTQADTIGTESDIENASSGAESAVSENAKVSSPPKNKRGKRRGNNTSVEDGGTETKKMRNVSAEESSEDVKYEVESIEDMRQRSGKTQFRIRWKGYGPDRDTWENEEDLSCPNIIKAFLEKNKNESKAKKRGGKAADSSVSRKTKNDAGEDDDEDEKEEDESKEYEVESIEDMRQRSGKTQFRIRWKGYGPDRDTWENEEDLSCPNIIKAFLEKNKNESKAKKRGGKAADSSVSRKTKNDPGEDDDEDEEEEGESKEYEVDKVMEVHFKKNGSREFLIHWKGFSHKDDTWEPEKNLSCPELIDKFMAKVDKAKSTASRELRMNPQHTDRFTLNMSQAGRRLSRRNRGKQRATYHGYM